MVKKKTLTFGDLKSGMSARIIGCTACSDELQRLRELGLTDGTRIEVVKVAPFGDPVEISVRGYRLCLRKRENCSLLLESIPSENESIISD